MHNTQATKDRLVIIAIPSPIPALLRLSNSRWRRGRGRQAGRGGFARRGGRTTETKSPEAGANTKKAPDDFVGGECGRQATVGAFDVARYS